MAVDAANEPLKMFYDLLAGVSALSSACGSRIGQTDGLDFSGFPCCFYDAIAEGMGESDAERWQVRDYRIQVDLWAGDTKQLRTLALAIDESLGSAVESGQVSSTNWSAKTLRRLKDWNQLAWKERKDVSGNRVFQYTSDWQFRVARKQ